MSEVSRPKKIFAKSTIAALIIIAILYVLVNVAYVRPTSLLQQKWAERAAYHILVLRRLTGPTALRKNGHGDRFLRGRLRHRIGSPRHVRPHCLLRIRQHCRHDLHSIKRYGST